MAFDNLLLERDGAVAIVTINRPNVLNALNSHTVDELRRLMLELKHDAAVGAIVLTGASITFFTHDDDKDNDTFLNVQVVAPGGRVCAGLSGTFGLFPDQSTRGPFGLSVQSNVLKDSLPGGHLTISVQPNGNDTWRFGYQLDLTFSDGSVAHTSQAAVQLTQDSRTLTQPLAF